MSNTEKFEKKLITILNSSSNAKAWSDLLPVVKDILSHLVKYDLEIDFSKISTKHILAKRLAQCLNPEFPNGVHEVVLDIYTVLLKNINNKKELALQDNLSLYLCGLFPFFSHASLQNKKKFLDNIVKGILITIQADELMLCFPGILSAIIPGLDDNDEKTTKLIFQSFDDFINKFASQGYPQIFFGSMWTILLRNQHLRNGGMKYLVEKIITYEDLIEKPQEEQKELIEFYYPNVNTTTINALGEIILDKEAPTMRYCMDFIMTRFPLIKKNTIITDEAKINLIIKVLNSLIKNESSVIRRLNRWFSGLTNMQDDESDIKNEDLEYIMNLTSEAFKRIFNPEINYSQEELINKLKILKQFFKEKQNFSNFVLSKISLNVLKCVVNFWQIELNFSENVNTNEVVSKIIDFYSESKYSELLWISLSEQLKSITEIKVEDELDISDSENTSIENFEKKLENTNLKSEDYLLDSIDENIYQLKFCLLFIDIKTNNGRIKHYFPIISNLLKICEKIRITQRESLKNIRQIILMTLVFIKTFQDKNLNEEENQDQLSNQLYGNNNNLNIERGEELRARHSIFVEILNLEDNIFSLINKKDKDKGKFLIAKESCNSYILSSNKDLKENVKSLSESILDFQKYFINFLSEYLKIKKDMQITKNEITIFKQCSELIIRLQEYCQQDDIPAWINTFEKIIFSPDINLQISLEAATFLIQLYSLEYSDSKIFKKIQKNLGANELKEAEIDVEVLKNITQKTGAKNNCYELLMGKFYLLLLEQNNQRTVINLLIQIIKLDNDKFEEMVYYTINDKNVSPFVEGIKLFNEFWKLTNELYPDDIFFPKGECIFKMLEFLDNKNPLLRHLSKTWLNQVNQLFSKILDPIVSLFLSKDINLLIEADKVFFTKEYDTTKILGAYSKLKNIILNCPIIPFLLDEKALKPEIFDLSKIGNPTLATLNYICLLVSIALRFTQANCTVNMSNEFKNECFGVNAASCEFLEFLIRIITEGDLHINVANELNKPLISMLDNAIETNNEVMQVQLLSVIKALDFNSSAEYENNPDKKYILFNLLKQDSLTKILIKGMTSDYYFIRENFLNFIKNCLPIFSLIIKTKEEFEKILGIGIYLISALTKYLAKKIKIESIGRKDNEKFSHFDYENNLIIFKNYLEEYKEYKTFDENDILLILKGINDILIYFLNIEYNDKEEIEKNDILSKIDPLNLLRKLQNLTFTNNNNLNKFGLTMTSNDFNGNWQEFKKNLISNPPKQNSNKNYIFTVCETEEKTRPGSKEGSLNPRNIYNNHIYNLLNGLILTWVNQSDRYEVYDYCLNLNGILAPTEISSWNNITLEELQKAKEGIKKNPIKSVIIEIAFNLFLANSSQFIEKILDLWCFGENNDGINSKIVNATKDKQFQLSIIELFISMNIPMNIIFYCINQLLISKLKPSENKLKKGKKNNSTIYDNSLFEAKIFHFIYSYILLNPINDKKEITEIWKEINNIFYTIIKNSKILYTYCWLYEIMQISLDKFPISNIDDFWVIRSMNDTFSTITTKLMEAAFDNKTENTYSTDEELVFPILPRVYTSIIKAKYPEDNLYIKDLGGGKIKKESKEELPIKKKPLKLSQSMIIQKNVNPLKKINSGELNVSPKRSNSSSSADKIRENNISIMSDFYEEYINEIKISSEYNKKSEKTKQNFTVLNKKYRQLAMLTLKENYLTICTSIFGEKLNENKRQLTEMLKGIINLIRSNENFLKQCASDFLVILMEKIPKHAIKFGKDLIMNYFYDPKFFKNDNLNLHNWSKIISQYALCCPEILNDLLNKIDDKNIFSVKVSESDKIRILRRIGFLIYSCKMDTFKEQFDIVKSKAKDLLSGYSSANNTSNLLEEEIFLIMRILFLRFSHDGVMKMIRDLWPIIFMELTQNITNEERNKDVKLVAESFKFIELLSLANAEEFTLYEWTFIIDTYNMENLDTRIPDSMINKLLNNKNACFKPLAINILSKGKLEVTDELLKGQNKGKSEAYIITKKNTFEELYEGIKKFLYSIVDTNNYKEPVNIEQIGQIIEDDFIENNSD